jgi:paired amphipathic helix protein Sin3a
MSVVDESMEISSVTSNGCKRSHKKGGGLSSGGGDLRKKLLKSEQAKSTGRKTRAQDASPSVSRLASPAPSETPSVQDRKSEIGDTDVHAKRISGRHIFFANSTFYTLLRLLEVRQSLSWARTLKIPFIRSSTPA